MTTIEIISPIAGKGLGRTYTAQPEIIDESNYIEIGIVARTNDGLVHSDLVVTITATDESQNKILNGTGITTKIYKNGIPETVLYYPFSLRIQNSRRSHHHIQCARRRPAIRHTDSDRTRSRITKKIYGKSQTILRSL